MSPIPMSNVLRRSAIQFNKYFIERRYRKNVLKKHLFLLKLKSMSISNKERCSLYVFLYTPLDLSFVVCLISNPKTKAASMDSCRFFALLGSLVVERQLDTSILPDNLSTGRPRMISLIDHPVPRISSASKYSKTPLITGAR